MAAETIGVVGVGLLGTAMAGRLTDAGFKVLGYDVNPAQLDALAAAGGACAGSAADVARSCRRVVLSLPDSRISAGVIEEIGGALAEGAVVVDTTTGDPEEMEAFAARLAARGVHYLDATVGGSSVQTRQGDAIVMAGATPDGYALARGVIEAISSKVFHVGPPGSGARMKLVLNLCIGLHRAVLAEALCFAEALGMNPAAALEVLKAGPGYSKAMDVKGRKMLERDYSVQARLAQHHKDVRLIVSAAARAGARVPLSTLHETLLAEAEAAGLGALDNSAIQEVFRLAKT
jgi:3-hydroxyisobutyrate dehydrogenase-like beta-hydroxyacid dehydrogenase